VFNYRYNKGQKGKVIEELRQNLLNSQDGIGNASNKTLKVIQSLQQDLILKDVFVRYEDLKLESKIGEGSYGIVYKATFRGAQVAVKQMRSPLFVDLTQKDIEEFRKEAYMMSRLRHPNIVLVMGISLIDIEPIRKRISSVSERTESSGSSKSKKESKRTVCIITEYLEQGSLADILYGPSRLPAEVWSYELILTCALQAARGMLYLHSHSPPICHRDLKCSNLVVDDHWVVKVTDFGMSRIIPEKIQDLDIGVGNTDKDVEDQLKYFFGRDTEASGSVQIDVKDINSNRITERNSNSNISISQNLEMTSNLGTTAWCAPELFTAGNTARYSVKVDVYSFGMVLWELSEKRRPFDNLTSRFDIMDAVREGLRPDINSNCPPAYRSLIERCWESEPSRRPMFKYIVRYLKEELAQVKRMQTATGPNRSISTDIATRLVNRVEDNEASSPSSLRANLKNILSWAQSKESTEKDTVAVPSSRAPLTIFDRGLSHLAGSPAVTSENITLAEQPLSFKNVAGGAGANRGAWRDRYVMKFSGWKTSQPDVGLPPSLGVGGNQTPNPMLTPQNYQDGTEIFDMECEGTGSPEIQLSSSNRSNK
jgi:serine/threonine protein kinase